MTRALAPAVLVIIVFVGTLLLRTVGPGPRVRSMHRSVTVESGAEGSAFAAAYGEAASREQDRLIYERLAAVAVDLARIEEQWRRSVTAYEAAA